MKQIRKKKVLIIITITFIIATVLIVFLNCKYYKIVSRVENVTIRKKEEEKKNYKTIGWLRVQGTNIDYPIIKNKKENDEYSVEMEKYVWTQNKDGKMHNNFKIEGHNIFNLSSSPMKQDKKFKRLEELMSFVYYEEAKKNQYIQLTIDNKEYIYKIFSVSFLDSAQQTFIPKYDELDKKRKERYIDVFMENNLYDYDVDVKPTDKFITLSTCTRFFGVEDTYGFYVSGRMVRKNEKIKKSRVRKSKIYNEIWEGEKNEESV